MKTRLPLLLLLALTLVALPALAQKTPKAVPKQVSRQPLEKVQSPALQVPCDLTCKIEVYSPKGQAIQNGSELYNVTGKYRVKISAILEGKKSVSNVKLTYNWSRNGKWQRPTNDPWSHTFANIAAGATVATVDAPPFEIEVYENAPHRDSYRIEATIDADNTVDEHSTVLIKGHSMAEINNTCSFEFFVQGPPI